MTCVRALPGRRDPGFTLIEALVVLAILGLVTAAVAVPMNSYWQRSRIQSAAGDIRTFLQTAYTESVNQHTPITVTLQQNTATGHWELRLSPPPAQLPLGTYVIPDFVSLAYNPVGSAGGWPTAPSPWGGNAMSLVCTTSAFTMIPDGATCPGTCGAGEVAGSQALQVKTLSISHTSMVDGSLTPNIRYDIQIFPIWNVSYSKVIL